MSTALADRYRIERELGSGGMATVYLAEDVRHHRHVAIKVLHPELSAVLGSERFLKEIELTANLQHPHILPLFDSGSADGLLYYVMPYVEGESLRSRLNRERQLPIADAVRIATDVAGALEYAHKRGIVHRDIKPENILLLDGRPVMADFGIALAVQQAGGSRMTQTGMSLGTPQYMAPEQAMGDKSVDHRADLYALGTVTYEMLVGEPPFSGPSAQAIVARVMTETPRPLRPQRHTVPEHVEAAVLRSLEKLPADRFLSAADFGEALSGPAAGGPQARTRAAIRRPLRTVTQAAPWILAVAAVLVAGWSLSRKTAPRSLPTVRYSLAPPQGSRIIDVGGSPVAIRPDGGGLVYLGLSPGSPRRLFRWDFDDGAPTPIPGTENASFPFFSPDGKWVAFFSNGQLRKAAFEGGGVVPISGLNASVGSFRGATWTSKGEIVYATSSGLNRIPADGGTVQPIPFASGGFQLPFFPAALPGGDVVVGLLGIRASVLTELAVVSPSTGQVTKLGLAGSNPRFVEPGWLAFTNTDGGLLAVRFDPRRRRVMGQPRPIAQGITLGTAGVGKLDVSRSGVVAYLEGYAREERQLMRLDRRGGVRVFDAPPRTYNGPRISPDGKRIAVTIGAVPNPPMDIWVYDIGLGTLTRVTFDSTSVHPEWSADGQRLFHRQAGHGFKAMVTRPDGSAPAESLYATDADLWEVVPTRSGDTIITRELRSVESDRDLLLVPIQPSGPAVPWAAGARIQAEPAFSPDGKWLAYASDESGNFEVYVRAFPGPGPRYAVSSSGGLAPRWNPKGGELFYLSTDSLIAVPVRPQGAGLEFGRGKVLFAARFAALNFHAPYDVAPDGTWFAFVGIRGGTESGVFRIVHHWFEQP